MSENQEEIFVIHFFDAPALGLGSKKLFQPHITFLAHVLCDEFTQYANILQQVELIAQKTTPFSLAFESIEYFGVDKDKPVAQLRNSKPSQELHLDLLRRITGLGFNLGQPEYAGAHFSPHMSLESEAAIETVEEHFVDSLTVVINHANSEGTTEVLGNFRFFA